MTISVHIIYVLFLCRAGMIHQKNSQLNLIQYFEVYEVAMPFGFMLANFAIRGLPHISGQFSGIGAEDAIRVPTFSVIRHPESDFLPMSLPNSFVDRW